mmetsp:Transcript_41038/g.96413  ORF Transcript_41038/g.96413 Transcript_41038/m.96413 type:complete len:205 (-) Transcript_41038:207-821(-)
MPQQIKNHAHQGKPQGISEVVVVVVVVVVAAAAVTEQLGPPTVPQTLEVNEGELRAVCTCVAVVPGATPPVPGCDTVLPVSLRRKVEAPEPRLTQSSEVPKAAAMAAIKVASKLGLELSTSTSTRTKPMTFTSQSVFSSVVVGVVGAVSVTVAEVTVAEAVLLLQLPMPAEHHTPLHDWPGASQRPLFFWHHSSATKAPPHSET